MPIQYLTNILDPILKAEQPFRSKVRTVLVSKAYSSSFTSGKYQSSEFDFVLSDNGNFTSLNAIAKKHLPQSIAIEKIAAEEFEKRKKLSTKTLNKRIALNKTIISACNKELAAIDYKKVTSKQLAIAPHAIIGAEDTTIPVLQICGAFKPIYKNCFPNLTPFQNNTIKLYSAQQKGKYGNKDLLDDIKKYIVVHAYDYNTITKAIQNIKKNSPEAVAISLGGPLECKGSLNSIIINNKTITFTEPHPESYVLTIAYLLAIKNNVSKNIPIHILGLGSPILILLAAYIFKSFKTVTIDSTATSKDVEVNIIYGNKNGLFKMNAFNLAAYHIVYNKSFKGISPYFNHFEKQFPSNWKALRKKFESITSNKKLSKKDQVSIIRKMLEANPTVFKNTVPFFLPLKYADKKLKKPLRIARCFENYWVNVKLCNDINKVKGTNQFRKFTLNEVTKFAKYGSKDYVEAINELIKIIDKS